MKAAASALWENAIRAAVKMLKAGCGLHQQFQCLQITGFEHYDSGVDGILPECRSCRFHRPFWK